MPYLNWLDAKIGVETREHREREAHLVISLDPGKRDELRARADEVLGAAAREGLAGGRPAELRVDLPRGWTLFFKLRDSGSRVMMAHPEKAAWVGTVWLEPSAGETFLSKLASGNGSLNLSEVADLDRFSNLELSIVFAASAA